MINKERHIKNNINCVKFSAKNKTFVNCKFGYFKTLKTVEKFTTSNSIKPYIQLAIYAVHCQINYFEGLFKILSTHTYGWKLEEYILMPEGMEVILSPADKLVYDCTDLTCS